MEPLMSPHETEGGVDFKMILLGLGFATRGWALGFRVGDFSEV